MARPALLAMAMAMLCAGPALADGRFRNLMSYGEARGMLQRLGYRPYLMPGSDVCDPNEPRCFPELEYCVANRLAGCTYTWKRGRSIIEVSTQYVDPVVVRSQCVVNCGKRAEPSRAVRAGGPPAAALD